MLIVRNYNKRKEINYSSTKRAGLRKMLTFAPVTNQKNNLGKFKNCVTQKIEF